MVLGDLTFTLAALNPPWLPVNATYDEADYPALAQLFTVTSGTFTVPDQDGGQYDVYIYAGGVGLVGQASETDTAQVINYGQFVSVGQTAETDTAFTIGAVNAGSIALGTALETDTALPVVPQREVLGVIGQALETDIALALGTLSSFVAVNIASETDTAGAVLALQPGVVGVAEAVETDSALGITVVNTATGGVLGVAVETDSAQPISTVQNIYILLGTAGEVDAAAPLINNLQVIGPTDVTGVAGDIVVFQVIGAPANAVFQWYDQHGAVPFATAAYYRRELLTDDDGGFISVDVRLP